MANPRQVARQVLQEDPVLLHSRREAVVILCLWGCCLVYTTSYCYLNGYLTHTPHPDATGPALAEFFGELKDFDRDPATLKTPLGLGIPDWVFYGIVLPWLGCIAATFWFCLGFFVEDDLDDDLEDRHAQPTLSAGPSGPPP